MKIKKLKENHKIIHIPSAHAYIFFSTKYLDGGPRGVGGMRHNFGAGWRDEGVPNKEIISNTNEHTTITFHIVRFNIINNLFTPFNQLLVKSCVTVVGCYASYATLIYVNDTHD